MTATTASVPAATPQEEPECRYLVNDFGTSQSPKSTRLRDNLCAPARPAVGAGLDKHTPSPTPPTNGLTACRMSLQIFSAGYGKHTPSPLRKPARTYAYRGLPALASLSLAGSGGNRLRDATPRQSSIHDAPRRYRRGASRASAGVMLPQRRSTLNGKPFQLNGEFLRGTR